MVLAALRLLLQILQQTVLKNFRLFDRSTGKWQNGEEIVFDMTRGTGFGANTSVGAEEIGATSGAAANFARGVADQIPFVGSKNIIGKVTWGVNDFSDNIGRASLYIQKRYYEGMGHSAAAKSALDSFIDYGDKTKWMKSGLAQVMAPFQMWKRGALVNSIRWATTRPEEMAAVQTALRTWAETGDPRNAEMQSDLATRNEDRLIIPGRWRDKPGERISPNRRLPGAEYTYTNIGPRLPHSEMVPYLASLKRGYDSYQSVANAVPRTSPNLTAEELKLDPSMWGVAHETALPFLRQGAEASSPMISVPAAAITGEDPFRREKLDPNTGLAWNPHATGIAAASGPKKTTFLGVGDVPVEARKAAEGFFPFLATLNRVNPPFITRDRPPATGGGSPDAYSDTRIPGNYPEGIFGSETTPGIGGNIRFDRDVPWEERRGRWMGAPPEYAINVEQSEAAARGLQMEWLRTQKRLVKDYGRRYERAKGHPGEEAAKRMYEEARNRLEAVARAELDPASRRASGRTNQ